MRYPVLVLLLASVGPAWADIGTVTEHKGTGCEIHRDKSKLPGDKGAAVKSMDTVVTGGCVSNITFKDDTKVRVTENSRLMIDDFVYDPKASDAGKLAMKVGMGTVRYASGQVAKNNPQRVNIKTPTSTVAVRGTDFTMTVDEAGQSLVVLVPSCKDPKDVKQYELEENRCAVGRIEVTTLTGTVTLDQPFQATYVASASANPTPAALINTVESKISNNLIIVKPLEVQRAIREAMKTKQELELEEIEAEAARQLSQKVKQSAEEIEQARILAQNEALGKNTCNASTHICINWERSEPPDRQSRGRGVAYRSNEDHYAEVKTPGYSSNTSLLIVHNDAPATELIGDGNAGGNTVIIRQSTGVLRR